MKLPNAGSAVIDLRKLQEYCLSTTHRYGRHKARLFANTLGETIGEIDLLYSALLAAANERDAIATRDNGFGQLYEVIIRDGRTSRVGNGFEHMDRFKKREISSSGDLLSGIILV